MMKVGSWVGRRLTSVSVACPVPLASAARQRQPVTLCYPQPSKNNNTVQLSNYINKILLWCSYNFLEFMRLCSNVQGLLLQVVPLVWNNRMSTLMYVIVTTIYHSTSLPERRASFSFAWSSSLPHNFSTECCISRFVWKINDFINSVACGKFFQPYLWLGDLDCIHLLLDNLNCTEHLLHPVFKVAELQGTSNDIHELHPPSSFTHWAVHGVSQPASHPVS